MKELKILAALTLSAFVVMGTLTLIIALVVTYDLHNNLIAAVVLAPLIFGFTVFMAFKVVDWSWKIFGLKKAGGG